MKKVPTPVLGANRGFIWKKPNAKSANLGMPITVKRIIVVDHVRRTSGRMEVYAYPVRVTVE